jgi:hypothetical protein
MSHITLVLPHLLPPPEFAPDLVRALQAPALAALLTRTSAHERKAAAETAHALPHEQWLARTLGLSREGLPAFAAAAMRGFGHEPLDGTWFIVNPAHIQIARSHSMMADLRHLGLSEDDSRSLYEATRPLCEEIGHPLLYGDAQTWFLRADDWTGFEAATPDTVVGMDLSDFVPRGKQALPLRRLQNEVQMLWHTHPVNAAREARRLPSVNSFWLWGASKDGARAAGRLASIGVPGWIRGLSSEAYRLRLGHLGAAGPAPGRQTVRAAACGAGAGPHQGAAPGAEQPRSPRRIHHDRHGPAQILAPADLGPT